MARHAAGFLQDDARQDATVRAPSCSAAGPSGTEARAASPISQMRRSEAISSAVSKNAKPIQIDVGQAMTRTTLRGSRRSPTGTRTMLAPTELPVGALTALVGGPVFLTMLRRELRRRRT